MGLDRQKISAWNFGCAGFLKILSRADALVPELTVDARILVLNVETPESWHDASDRLFCGIVSAGATAAVLEFERGLPLSVISSDDFEVPGELRLNPAPLFHRDLNDVFSFRAEPRHTCVMRMNAEPVFLGGIELMLNNLRAALKTVDRSNGQRVIVAPHQPSGKLLKALIAAAHTEFPDVEFLNNLSHYGNTISASVPTLLSRLDEVLQRNELRPPEDGDLIVLLAAGICMEEIENHMSAGHACLTWQSDTLNARRPDAALAAV